MPMYKHIILIEDNLFCFISQQTKEWKWCQMCCKQAKAESADFICIYCTDL